MSPDFLPPARCEFFPRRKGKNRISQGVENRGSLISVPLALREGARELPRTVRPIIWIFWGYFSLRSLFLGERKALKGGFGHSGFLKRALAQTCLRPFAIMPMGWDIFCPYSWISSKGSKFVGRIRQIYADTFSEGSANPLSGPVQEISPPPIAQFPFLGSIAEGVSHLFCLVFMWHRASIAEIPLLCGGGGIAPPLRMRMAPWKLFSATLRNSAFRGHLREMLGLLREFFQRKWPWRVANRRRTNVQQLTCNIDLSCYFYYYLFFSFILLELKPFVLKGKVLGEKWEKCEL